VAKTEVVTVEIARGGDPDKREYVNTVVFPSGVLTVPVSVEIRRSKEVSTNDWFTVGITATRHCVENAAEIRRLRDQLIHESMDKVNDIFKQEMEEG